MLQVEQETLEGCSPDVSGLTRERISNYSPRLMIVSFYRQNSAYRFTRIFQSYQWTNEMSSARSKNIFLTPNTIGNSLAAIHLMDMLNQDIIPVIEKHRLLSIFNSISIGFKKISKIEDVSFRYAILNMWKEKQFTVVDSQNWDPKVKTYFKNIVNAHVKKYYESNAGISKDS
jgi:hypothetical protein